MIFLAWSSRPSLQEQTSFVKSSGFKFNYDDKFRGRTAKSSSNLQQDLELSDSGFVVNHARTLVGSGIETFEKGKIALQNWRHFSLHWVFVDPQTHIQSGSNFCVCFKALFPWILMPLQIAYVNESKNNNGSVASFGFGSGTLQGHMLAGEERFSVTMDEKSNVWYEILSFSKPTNFLSFICYPYVLLMQKHFARESSMAMQNHLSGKSK